MKKGFTLIELVVVIVIIAVLSGIVMYAVAQYINKGKDSNIYGNLVVLVPAGEFFYNGNNNSYQGFCTSSAANVAFSQMPGGVSGTTHYCAEDSSHNYQAWVACVKEFTVPTTAYCVDSRGMKDEIAYSECTAIASTNPMQCPNN